MKLQLLDELIAIGHGKYRSTDCIMAINSKGLPAPDILRAQEIFPKAGKYAARLQEFRTLQDFLNVPLPTPWHIEVARIRDNDLLALKMSHILGDAVSMLLFIKAMLGHEVENGEPELRSFPPKKDTPYRKFLNSTLWPRKGKTSFRRSFLYETISHEERPDLNDLMLLSLLEALPIKRKAVWVPVNVRKDFWKGFGNGLSRMRIYPPPGQGVPEKIAHIRKQKEEAMNNGEVALPPSGFNIHDKKQKFLYDLWIRRPWADWATISFSHLKNSRGFLDGIGAVRGISNIMPAHHGAIFAFTNNRTTDFTFSYDPATVTDKEAQILLRDFLTQVRAKLECGK